ncbi:MAG: flagellar basal body P-ring protein FlgI [Gemmataceae bacterium]
MTRRASFTRRLARAGLWLAGPAALLLLIGCQSTAEALRRGKSDDDSELHRYDVPTVGDWTTVGNAEPTQLGGVGLVEGLEGTGGDCNQDAYRAMLLEQMTKDRVPNASTLLKSPECALVVVEAAIPPGAHKDDLIDVEVKLPPGSKATSLRGGVLRKTYLFNYDFQKNLSPNYKDSNGMMMGHRRAIARGPVIVGAGQGDDAVRVKSGRIWAGAKLIADQPLALVMNQERQQGRYTSLIADRLNTTFQTTGLRGALDSSVAHTGNATVISLRVPVQYRHNLPRYLRVVRAVPLGESADAPGKTESDRRSYRQKLADDLLDPSRAVVAALRLEGLGAKSIPVFKDKGLKSEHPLVRFVSAEALAYLGSPAAGEELYRAAVEYPLFRAYALTALASLDEAVCHLKLKELIVSNLDDEVRYGAFRALRLLNENEPLVRGEHLNESFWLHRIAPDTKPLIHVSTSKRAEVVLFGQSPRLTPPFSILAGEFAVTATKDDDRCTVSRFPARGEPVRRQCPLTVEAVLTTMAELGGQYPEVVTMLQQAASCDGLSCRVRVDAVPQAPTVHELVKAGKDAADLVPAGQDLGRTPDLFQVGLPLSETGPTK